MASSSKTAHLRLNQWSSGDPILRTDFNMDNAKLDMAVNDRSLVYMETKTLTAAASSVSVDLSDWDLTGYSEVQMDFFPITSSGGSGGPMTSLRVNSGTATDLARMTTDGTKGLRIHLCLLPGGIGGSFSVPGTGTTGGFSITGVTAASLETIQLICGDSAAYQSGTVCAVYGLKK